MIGYPLHVCEYVNKVYTHIYLANARFSAVYVDRLQILDYPVHDLLKRLDLDHILDLHTLRSLYRQRDYLLYRRKSDLQLAPCVL